MEFKKEELIQKLYSHLISEYEQDNQSAVRVVKGKIVKLLPEGNEEKKAYVHELILSQNLKLGDVVGNKDSMKELLEDIIVPLKLHPGGDNPPPDLDDIEDFKRGF